MNFNFFPQRDNRIPNLNASIKAQHKHEPIMRAVRVNGKISEVMQPALRLILRWVTIWDPNILSFFSLAMIGKNIRQISQILLISLTFGKSQLFYLSLEIDVLFLVSYPIAFFLLLCGALLLCFLRNCMNIIRCFLFIFKFLNTCMVHKIVRLVPDANWITS